MENNAISKEMEKDKRKTKELKKLKKIFQNLDENKSKIAQKLIESAAFLIVELEDLEKEIAVKGVTEEYQNGEFQKGVKKASRVDVYNNFIKNYTLIVKQLCDLLPEDEIPTLSAGNEVLKFAMEKPIK